MPGLEQALATERGAAALKSGVIAAVLLLAIAYVTNSLLTNFVFRLLETLMECADPSQYGMSHTDERERERTLMECTDPH